MNVQDVYDAIASGEVDENFDEIFDAIQGRRDVLSKRRALELTVGMRVRLANVRPKYLVGMQGAISERNGNGTFTVALDEEYQLKAGRYVRDGELHNCKAGILEVVTG